jgi:hypothetical protein
VRIERVVGSQRKAADLIVVFIVMRFGEKCWLEFENTVEIEGVTAKHLGEIDAWMGLSFADAAIDRPRLASIRE